MLHLLPLLQGGVPGGGLIELCQAGSAILFHKILVLPGHGLLFAGLRSHFRGGIGTLQFEIVAVGGEGFTLLGGHGIQVLGILVVDIPVMGGGLFRFVSTLRILFLLLEAGKSFVPVGAGSRSTIGHCLIVGAFLLFDGLLGFRVVLIGPETAAGVFIVCLRVRGLRYDNGGGNKASVSDGCPGDFIQDGAHNGVFLRLRLLFRFALQDRPGQVVVAKRNDSFCLEDRVFHLLVVCPLCLLFDNGLVDRRSERSKLLFTSHTGYVYCHGITSNRTASWPSGRAWCHRNISCLSPSSAPSFSWKNRNRKTRRLAGALRGCTWDTACRSAPG